MIYFDLETYSETDLKEVGLYVYASHPSTDVLCAAWEIHTPGAKIVGGVWNRGDPPPNQLHMALRNGYRIKAHNCAFDAEVWRCVLAERYGWWWPGYGAWLDSMAQAMLTNLPGKLEQAAKFFGSHEKSKTGHDLMRKLCKPARKTKNLHDEKRHHSAENLRALRDYCVDDVRAERGFVQALPELSHFEERVWRETWAMNRRGVQIDVPLVLRCQELVEQARDHGRRLLTKLTQGDVESEGQRGKLGDWLAARGASVPKTEAGNWSFSKDVLDQIDIPDGDENAERVFDLYRSLASSSVAKFSKMLACAGSDGRIRGMFTYSGAGQTGRWAGREVQLQNLPRGLLKITEHGNEYEIVRDLIMDGCDVQELEDYFGQGRALDVLSSMIRACLIPAPGKKFVFADYSAIEGRTAAWVANEEHILQAYREGKRLYAVVAAGIFKTTYEAVVAAKKAGDSKMDAIGKTADLACQFGGAVGSFKKMGGKRLGMSEEDMAAAVKAWRDTHPKTSAMWKLYGNAAMEAIRAPGQAHRLPKQMAVGHNGSHLRLRLPSQRLLWYRRAQIGEKRWPDGGTTPTIRYMGVDDNKRVGWVETYGATLFQNGIQSIARDLMADAMVRGADQGWPWVMTVHDELGAELDIDDPRDHHDLCALFRESPDWARGLPLDAAGWTGDRYRKD